MTALPMIKEERKSPPPEVPRPPSLPKRAVLPEIRQRKTVVGVPRPDYETLLTSAVLREERLRSRIGAEEQLGRNMLAVAMLDEDNELEPILLGEDAARDAVIRSEALRCRALHDESVAHFHFAKLREQERVFKASQTTISDEDSERRAIWDEEGVALEALLRLEKVHRPFRLKSEFALTPRPPTNTKSGEVSLQPLAQPPHSLNDAFRGRQRWNDEKTRMYERRKQKQALDTLLEQEKQERLDVEGEACMGMMRFDHRFLVEASLAARKKADRTFVEHHGTTRDGTATIPTVQCSKEAAAVAVQMQLRWLASQLLARERLALSTCVLALQCSSRSALAKAEVHRRSQRRKAVDAGALVLQRSVRKVLAQQKVEQKRREKRLREEEARAVIERPQMNAVQVQRFARAKRSAEAVNQQRQPKPPFALSIVNDLLGASSPMHIGVVNDVLNRTHGLAFPTRFSSLKSLCFADSDVQERHPALHTLYVACSMQTVLRRECLVEFLIRHWSLRDHHVQIHGVELSPCRWRQYEGKREFEEEEDTELHNSEMLARERLIKDQVNVFLSIAKDRKSVV